MKFNFIHLNEITRTHMLEEVKRDITSNNLYLSKRFTPHGKSIYPQLLNAHIKEGNELTLAEDLQSYSCFKTMEERVVRGKVTHVKVPQTATITFAQGEFNRFYIRAICVQAIEAGKQLQVYRARYSENPRSDSEYIIGTLVNAELLLTDLRLSPDIDTALGLPNGPNSGLSVRLLEVSAILES